MKQYFIYIYLFNFVFGNTAVASNIISVRQPKPSTVIGHRSSVIGQPSTNAVNRFSFYKAMRGDSKEQINAELTELKSEPSEISDAFTGTLLMKKASFGGSPATKLNLFKQGRKMLEAAIKKEPENAEYRFLRLMIQENAPGILGYKYDLEKDSQYIRKSYQSLPEDVQQAIVDYSKKSRILKLDVS
jgi:hypothetical protein